ncbi:MAG: hypothetical protein RBR65_07485 [Aliarcobacter sp.]|nr:hypothetical protein [Aliarcobacter sp.]
MRGKNKSFIEDTIILFIIGVIIYAIYSFFFTSDENDVLIEENKITLENNIESNEKKEILTPIENDENMDKIDSEKIEENKTLIENHEIPLVENNKDTISIKKEEIEEKIIEPKKVETSDNQVNLDDEKVKIDLFYKSIKEKIYANIEKNVDKNLINTSDVVNIRITILKDGKYEQLTFVDGNKKYFELYKDSITKVFPLAIDNSIKRNFPRYFRFTIEK